MAGSVEASAGSGDVRARRVGVDRGAAARRQRQPTLWLATTVRRVCAGAGGEVAADRDRAGAGWVSRGA